MSDENGGFIERGRRKKKKSGFVYLVAFDLNYYY